MCLNVSTCIKRLKIKEEEEDRRDIEKRVMKTGHNNDFIQRMCTNLCVSVSLYNYRAPFKSIFLDNSCVSALAPAQ